MRKKPKQKSSEEIVQDSLDRMKRHAEYKRKHYEPNNKYMSDIIGGELRQCDIEVEERLKMLEAGYKHIDTLPYKNLLVQEHLKKLEQEAQQKRITRKREKRKSDAEKKLFKDVEQST